MTKQQLTDTEKKEKKRLAMQLYRQKKRNENPEKFMQQQRETKQKQRKKSTTTDFVETFNPKPVKIKIKKVQTIDPKPIKMKVIKKKELIKASPVKEITPEPIKPVVSENTMYNYISNVRRIYIGMHPDDVYEYNFGASFLVDFDKVRDYILNKYTNKNTVIHQFKSIVSYLSILEGNPSYKDVKNKYQQEMMKYKGEQDKVVGENKPTESQQKNLIDYNILIEKLGSDMGSHRDNILYALYVAIPPRRADYKFLKLIIDDGTQDYAKLDKKFNYLIVNKSNKPLFLVFNNYKTAKTYGQVVVNVNLKQNMEPFFKTFLMSIIIEKNLNLLNLKNGDLLFPDTNGNVIQNYTEKLNNLFSFTGKNISVNMLRHSYINWVHSHKNLSNNMLKFIADTMGHSVSESLLYRKF